MFIRESRDCGAVGVDDTEDDDGLAVPNGSSGFSTGFGFHERIAGAAGVDLPKADFEAAEVLWARVAKASKAARALAFVLVVVDVVVTEAAGLVAVVEGRGAMGRLG